VVDDEDEAIAALWELGTEGVEVQSTVASTILLAYFTERPELEHELARVFPKLERTSVPQVDWVARFREGFRAFSAGGFRIAPAWDVPPDADPRLLIVDPGRAFGTGTHETTRLCLGALERLASRRRLGRALDLGCGTALLAIAAARLGAQPVVALDNDPEALGSAREHARLNAVDVRLVLGDGGAALVAAAFDLVLANITAPLLAAHAGEIAALVAPGGALVLSGLLESDLGPLRDAYIRLGAPDVLSDGEWAALVYAS
jgi:ribosomal protein L11 methyltransferase